jgi:hypothetical protein
MKTALAMADDSSLLSWEDCLEWINWQPGQLARYYYRIENSNNRIGQAWFNSLRPEDAERLRGTYADPFYSDKEEVVKLALAFLLEN